jgi:simple sugar transport system permease protein
VEYGLRFLYRNLARGNLMFGGIDPTLLIASLMVASVPIMLAAIGELVVEKAGVLNLGVEGMMIMGAICGFVTAVETGSPFLGFIGGALGATALAMVFGLLTQFLLANQVATGLALTLFGLGLSSLIGQGYVGIKPPLTSKVPFGPLADLPVIGRILFGHDPVVYLSIAIIAGVWAMLKFSRAGLILRAVGESHDAAHALGYKVTRIRLMAIAFGGAMAGLGGAYVSLVRVPQWTDGITSGAGWIALAIVVFASWKPWRVLIGAYLFGGISVLQLNLQAAGARIPVEYLSMSPYLITILVLVIMSSGRGRAANTAPATLGQNFHASR